METIGLSRPRIAREVARRGAFGTPNRGAGAVYGAYQRPYESVAGGGDGAFVAAGPLCANSRAFVLYRAMRYDFVVQELADHQNSA